MCVPCIFVLNSVSPGDIVFGWSIVLRRHIPRARACECACVVCVCVVCVCVCVCVCGVCLVVCGVCVCVCERERERERELHSLYLCSRLITSIERSGMERAEDAEDEGGNFYTF